MNSGRRLVYYRRPILDEFHSILISHVPQPCTCQNSRQPAGIDPNLSLTNTDSFDHVIRQAFTSRQLQMSVMSLSAAALLLAVVVLYGVLSCSVTLRRRELIITGRHIRDVF
jgi:hypothetical protein